MPENKRGSVLAVDIGGTKTIVALVSSAGKIVYRRYFLTLAEKGSLAVINQLSSAINRSIDLARLKRIQLTGIGIAIAGILDTRRGVVTTSPNLPGWRNVPLRDIIAARSGLATYLINDASAAALGEHRFGAGKGCENMLYLTVSTGIGGGIIIGGELYSGTDGSAGELGHMVIKADGPKCHCDNFGCLESLASGWAIAQEASIRIKRGDKTSITKLVNGGVDDITAETVATAAKQGDRVARYIIAEAADYLGIGLANMVNIFNPELIVIGGGLSKMGSALLNPARKVIKQRAFKLPARSARVVKARLGINAGIIGSAVYVSEIK
jgi:glucokinase